MPKFGNDTSTFLVGLNSLWRTLFLDQEHLKTLYKGAGLLLGQDYFDVLQFALSTSLEDTPVYENKYWHTFGFLASDLTVQNGSAGKEYVLPLSSEIIDFRYLQNRLTSPSLILERDFDFRIETSPSGGLQVVFGADPFSNGQVPSVFLQQDPVTYHTGKDGLVESGTPNEHLSSDPATLAAELSARHDVRRTFKTRGVTHTIFDGSFFEGKESWIYSADAIFTAADVGKKIKVYTPTEQTKTITLVPSPNIAIVDSVFVGVAATFDYEVIDEDLFKDEFLGYQIVIDDISNSNNNGTYVIDEVVSGLEVKLDRPLEFADPSAVTYTAVTYVNATKTFTIPTASTRFTPLDVGKYLYVSDGTNAGWFRIASVGAFNANDFATEVVVLDVPDDLAAYATTGLKVSVHQQIQQASTLVWVMQSPSVIQKITLYAPDLSVERSLLSQRYGELVGRESASSQRYKNLLQGIYQYFWVGPTFFALESALNVMVGFPVVESDDEVLIRVDETDDADTVVTDVASYVLPVGSVKDEYKDPSAWSRTTFKRLQSLTDLFIIEDHVSDPTWFYNLLVPDHVLPDEPESRRIAQPQLSEAVFDGSWNFGDPGIFLGGHPDGSIPENGTLKFKDSFVSGTTLTSFATRFFPEYLGKIIYLENRPRKITGLVGPNTVTLSAELDAPILDYLELPNTAVSGDLLTIGAAEPYFLKEVNDIGRAVNTTAGIFVIASLDDNKNARLVDIDGNPAALAPATVTAVLAADSLLINKVALKYPLGYVAARGFASPNMFGVRYDLDITALEFADLQEDIQEIIREGKPSHTIFINQPFQTLEDLLLLSDNIDRFGFNFVGDNIPIYAKPLTFGGDWELGEFFFYANNYLTWEKRLAISDIASLPAGVVDGSGFQLYPVFDARESLEIYLRLDAPPFGQQYDVEVWAWDDVGSAWFNTGQAVSFDTDNPVVKLVPVGGMYLAFKLTYNTDTEAALIVGSRRNSQLERRSTALYPANSAASMTLGSDLLVDTSFDWFVSDIGRELFISYDVGGSLVMERARIVDRIDRDTVRLLDADTSLPLLALTTTGTVSWKFGAQRRWGQTPVTLGVTHHPSPDVPGGIVAGRAFSLELPVQTTIRDVIPGGGIPFSLFVRRWTKRYPLLNVT